MSMYEKIKTQLVALLVLLGIKKDEAEKFFSEDANGNLVISLRKIQEYEKQLKAQKRSLRDDDTGAGNFLILALMIVFIASIILPMIGNQTTDIENDDDLDADTKNIASYYPVAVALMVLIYLFKRVA